MNKGLSDLALRKLTADGQARREVWDTRLPGFGVRVSDAGTKTFMLLCRVNGRQRRLSLGRYPVVSLAEARERAIAALQKAEAGIDPVVTNRKQDLPPDRLSIADAVERFVEMHCGRHNKRSTTLDVERRLRRHLVEKWGGRDVKSVQRVELIGLLDRLVNSGTPSEANHALAHIRKFFGWCLQRSYVDDNPCANISAPAKNRTRDRALSEVELRSLWSVLDAEGYPYGPYVKLLIFTGQRRGEVAGMEWSQINLAAREWVLPPELTKNSRRHVLPLSPAAVGVIAAIPRLHPRFVFPSRTTDDKPMAAFSKIKERLDLASGVVGWVLHDLRRTTATFLAKLDTQPHVIERILNHVSGSFSGVAGVYNRHPYMDEMRVALDRWGTWLSPI